MTVSGANGSRASAGTFLAIDLSPLAYRAFHGRGDSERTLRELLEGALAVIRPTHAIVAVDVPRRTWRHERAGDYKAGRPPKPDGLRALLNLAPGMANAMGISTVGVPGYEADDVVASAVAQAASAGLSPVVFSQDKDFYQLLDVAQIFDPAKGRLVTNADVRAKFGLDGPPRVLCHLQALIGDSADNIKGASGFGPQRAATLIRHYGSVQALYADVWSEALPRRPLTKAYVKALRGSYEDVLLALDLVTLARDVAVGDLERFRVASGVAYAVEGANPWD